VIYFIQDTHSKAIKIGISKNPKGRRSDLQTAHGSKLQLIGVMDGMRTEERKLHAQFSRLEGEWFEPTYDLLEFIRANAISGADFGQLTAGIQPATFIVPGASSVPLIQRLTTARDAVLLICAWLTFAYFVIRTAYLSSPLFFAWMQSALPDGWHGAILGLGIAGSFYLARWITAYHRT
jgi:hypothetical protein